ncbi:MAG: Gfo/Idh/MocA family oxidoreductase [Anaerolineae bacterium]|nr:Gfo/Idh/MocA family oxidoreductase [Anaerolineae bacterium]
MDKVRVGVIGVGQIGKHHLRTYDQIAGVEVVAVADINEAEAKRVAEMHRIRHIYTDFRDLLKRDDIQAVDVALHNNLHMPVTVAALQAGKDVYCEKPMAGAYCDAETMYNTAQELDRKLSIQLNSLFGKSTCAAKQLIDGGHLGKIYYGRSTGFRRRGRPFVDGYGTANFVQKAQAAGGAMYDMGVYHVALMLYLMGNPEVLTITGKVYQETDMDPERRAVSGYDVEELGVGFVRLSDNMALDLIESWAIHMGNFENPFLAGSGGGVRLEAFGSRGEPFGFFRNIDDLEMDGSFDLDAFEWRYTTLRENADAYIKSAQHHWIAALQGRVPLLPTAALALNTMLISEGIYLSEKLGREVTAPEVREQSVSTAVKV